MILENVNTKVGELVGLTLNPKVVPISSIRWTCISHMTVNIKVTNQVHNTIKVHARKS